MNIKQGHLIPENSFEQLALQDLRTHMPFFAVANEYSVNAFMRGYEKALKTHLPPEEAESILKALKAPLAQ